jgi:hypothetical protein
MNVGWILTVNLRPFLEILSHELRYDFDASDWTAVEFGLAGTDSEHGPWFDYPVGQLTVNVAFEPGADEMVSIRIDGDTARTQAKIDWLTDLLRTYEVRPRGGDTTT